MGRLIEADALEEAVQGAINIMESHGISMIAASVPLAIIKGTPTIDAIPVEWLKEKRKHMVSTGQDTAEQAIAYVLWLWRKEASADA